MRKIYEIDNNSRWGYVKYEIYCEEHLKDIMPLQHMYQTVNAGLVCQVNVYTHCKEEALRLLRSNFPHNEIRYTEYPNGRTYIIVDTRRIRTSRIKGPSKDVAEELGSYKEDLSKERGYGKGSLKGFDDADSLEDLGPIKATGTCGCCGKTLPMDHFKLRTYNGRVYKQSYCVDCQRLYARWYSAFLREHEVNRLRTEFTEGRKQRNKLFHEWLKTHNLG